MSQAAFGGETGDVYSPARVGPLPIRWVLAEAYESPGRADSAATTFESLITPKDMWFFQTVMRGIPESFAHQRLVLLYSQMGRIEDARRHYEIFTETFSDPDPEAAHPLDEAREALRGAERKGS